MKANFNVQQLISDDLELSSLPDIYNRVSSLLNDDDSSHEQIAAVIQTDPALSVRVLKVVNSSFYGYPQQISTILQAVAILGRRSLRNTVLSTIVAGMCRRMSNDVFELEAYWQHSVRAAVFSKLLAHRFGLSDDAESIFISGLLHDIGKLVIAHQLPEQARKIQLRAMEEDSNPYKIEQEELGFDHAELAAELMRQWALPDLLMDTIRYHHQPERATRCRDCCYIVYWADRLANTMDDKNIEQIQDEFKMSANWPAGSIDENFIPEIIDVASEQFQQVLAMFK